jgi:cell division protein FtsL
MKGLFSLEQLIALAVAALSALFTMLTYGHSTYATQRETETMERRLERLENKIDQVIVTLQKER